MVICHAFALLVNMHVCVCLCVCASVCLYVCVCVYVCVYVKTIDVVQHLVNCKYTCTCALISTVLK